MAILPVIAIGLPLRSNDAAPLTTHSEAMAMPQTPTVGIHCRYERRSRVRLYKDHNGFIAYTVEPGEHVLLEMELDNQVAGTSIRLAHNLMLELKSLPQPPQTFHTMTDIVQALYKFGGPQLQFESRAAMGVLQITELTAKGICHGQLKIAFTEPTVDRTGAAMVNLNWAF